jgi:UDP-N-acetylglucosamine 2-epimerase (non-hydrolysing)
VRHKILIVVGARPNFMKAAPLFIEFKKYKNIRPLLVHTGQHYDRNLSKVFLDDLKLPKPHFSLGIGSGTHSVQSGKMMIAFEKILVKQDPRAVMVVGDVNSTLACALAAVKYRCTRQYYRPFIAHVEAGLRSFDWHMPEEINRRLSDSLSDLLFITEPSAYHNLLNEGIAKNRIFYVGNIMHRPRNVDDRQDLKNILSVLQKLSHSIPIIFPIHPRTQKMLHSHRIHIDFLKTVAPLGYLDFLKLMMNAKFVLTDSGGIQEETTVLNVPCLTLRENTERPITVSLGTNIVVGKDSRKIMREAEKILRGRGKRGRIPKFWDGQTSHRICRIVHKYLKAHC